MKKHLRRDVNLSLCRCFLYIIFASIVFNSEYINEKFWSKLQSIIKINKV